MAMATRTSCSPIPLPVALRGDSASVLPGNGGRLASAERRLHGRLRGAIRGIGDLKGDAKSDLVIADGTNAGVWRLLNADFPGSNSACVQSRR
jgi:hypothetical protein